MTNLFLPTKVTNVGLGKHLVLLGADGIVNFSKVSAPLYLLFASNTASYRDSILTVSMTDVLVGQRNV